MCTNKRSDVKYREMRCRLLHFIRKSNITSLSQSSADKSNARFWQQFFIKVYCSEPTSDEDPRWEELLYHNGALQAFTRVLPALVRKYHIPDAVRQLEAA